MDEVRGKLEVMMLFGKGQKPSLREAATACAKALQDLCITHDGRTSNTKSTWGVIKFSRRRSILVGMLTILPRSYILSFMVDTFKYKPDDLTAIVWPRQNAPRVFAGEISWQEAVSGPDTGWAIDVEKADRVRVLIAVHDDAIEGAWRVIAATHHAEIPQGKTRKINRSHFDTVEDPRLAFLLRAPSPLLRRRNPQGVIELRDLPGTDALLSSVQPPTHGVVQLGAYTLIVAEDGSAEMRIPPEGLLGIRVAS